EIYNTQIYKVRSATDPLMNLFEYIDNIEEDLIQATKEMLAFISNPNSLKNYKKINSLVRSFNKNFDVDAGSLSNFSLSFLKKYRSILLIGIQK
ncbi:hypothetical protein N8011_02855, partial [Pseudomonadota bacterium]|nr:hypothetical protein [Pseudomonadota bacterium]